MRPLTNAATQIAVLSTFVLALSVFLAAAEVKPSAAKDSILGTVIAPTGEPIEEATVMAFNVNTGDATDTVTDKQGNYRLKNLAKGTYELSVASDGYDLYSSPEIELDGKTAVRHDVRMVETPQPGSVK